MPDFHRLAKLRRHSYIACLTTSKGRAYICDSAGCCYGPLLPPCSDNLHSPLCSLQWRGECLWLLIWWHGQLQLQHWLRAHWEYLLAVWGQWGMVQYSAYLPEWGPMWHVLIMLYPNVKQMWSDTVILNNAWSHLVVMSRFVMYHLW